MKFRFLVAHVFIHAVLKALIKVTRTIRGQAVDLLGTRTSEKSD